LKAADCYKALGAELVDISLPLIGYTLPVYYILACAEASSNLARYDGVKYGYRAEKFEGLTDLYVRSRTEGFGEEVKRRIMLGTYVLSSGYYDAYYKRARIAQAMLKEDFRAAFERCDVILTPVSPVTAFSIGEKVDDPVAMYLTDICTVSINIAGLPAVSIPCGYDRAGLPIGMQLIGKQFDDANLLGIGNAYEQANDYANRVAEVK
jgi:aspartyl-tRNA(Asn)/glutamyl-tRNA(Gln) amidotransferase subunit A